MAYEPSSFKTASQRGERVRMGMEFGAGWRSAKFGGKKFCFHNVKKRPKYLGRQRLWKDFFIKGSWSGNVATETTRFDAKKPLSFAQARARAAESIGTEGPGRGRRDRGEGRGRRHWLDVFATKKFTPIALHAKRGMEEFASIGILGRFEGVLTHDGRKTHQELVREPSWCNANHASEREVIHEERDKNGDPFEIG